MTMRAQCKECEEWLDLFSVKSHVCKPKYLTAEQVTQMLEELGIDPMNHAYREIAIFAWMRGRKI